MTGTIVVGIDGSRSSTAALDWAIGEATMRDSQLTLATIITPVPLNDPRAEGSHLDAMAEAAGIVLAQAGARTAAAGLTANVSVVRGSASGSLVELSKSAALVVVGKRGHGGFAERLLGSVSSSLAAHSHCPTVVVPDPLPGTTSQRNGVAVAVEPGTLEPAIWAAAEQACIHHQPLTLLAVRADTLGGARWLPPAYTEDPYPLAVEAEMTTMLAAVRARYPDLAVTHQVLVGNPAELLIRASENTGILVLGSRGHSGLAGLLWGSVSQNVLAHAHTPIMVVPD